MVWAKTKILLSQIPFTSYNAKLWQQNFEKALNSLNFGTIMSNHQLFQLDLICLFFAGLYYFFFVYETVIFRLLTLCLSSLCLMLSLRRPVCVIRDVRDRQGVKICRYFISTLLSINK